MEVREEHYCLDRQHAAAALQLSLTIALAHDAATYPPFYTTLLSALIRGNAMRRLLDFCSKKSNAKARLLDTLLLRMH
jgi:hypothetical protein